MILLENSNDQRLYDKATPVLKIWASIIGGGLYFPILITSVPVSDLINIDSMILTLVYTPVYFMLFMVLYMGLIAVFKYRHQAKVGKKYPAKSILINDESIIFKYDTKTIEFRFGNVINSNAWVLNIKDEFIVFDMANCYICCENKCDVQQIGYIKSVFNNIKNSKPARQYKNNDLKELKIADKMQDKIYVFFYRYKLVYFINLLFIIATFFERYLGYQSGVSYLATLTGIFAFFLTISNLTYLLLNLGRINIIKKIYFDSNQYYILDKDNYFIDCTYDFILEVEQYKDITFITTFDCGYILIKDENIREMINI